MRVDGSFAVEAPRPEVWAAFRDPASLAHVRSFHDVTPDGEGRFRATVEAVTSLGIARYHFAFQLLSEDPGRALSLAGHGTSSQHTIDVAMALSFADQAGGTTVAWEADIRLGGLIASIAQRTAPSIIATELGRWFEDLAGGRGDKAVGVG